MKKHTFNILKQAQQQPPVAPPATLTPLAAPVQPPQEAPEEQDAFGDYVSIEGANFQSPQDVFDALTEIGNVKDAIDAFVDRFGNENAILQDPDMPGRQGDLLNTIQEPIKEFFQTGDRGEKLKACEFLYHKIIDATDQSSVPAKLEEHDPHNVVASIVQESYAAIKKLASQDLPPKTANKVFNLKKYAQTQSLNNVTMFGPESTHFDPSSGMLISDWHLVEKNKGFGLTVENVLNIDWETTWRNNIMDKFYPGYIEDRFEVDKNIPEANNIQLKPGELRKPYLPEYGSLEARLEFAREEMNKERGYAPSEKGQYFNWKKAKAILGKFASKPELTDVALEDLREENKPELTDDAIEPLREENEPELNQKALEEKQENPLSKKAFNLSKYNKKKVAQLQNQADPFAAGDKDPFASLDKDPFQAPDEKTIKPNIKCGQCGKDLGVDANGVLTENTCSACGWSMGQEINAPKTFPNSQNPQQDTTFQVNRGGRVASASKKSGIFFDGKKFYCFAQSGKINFDSHVEAENFANQPIDNEEHPEVDIPVEPNNLHPKRKEVAQTADNLGI